jgi:hypothetical protein
MPTRKFREWIELTPAERQQRIAKRVRESLASMPMEEIRKARQMPQTKLTEALGVNQGAKSPRLNTEPIFTAARWPSMLRLWAAS